MRGKDLEPNPHPNANKSLKLYFKLCCLTLFLTILLVTLGGFVHNTGSSLACPDWPLCFGQVFPKMEGGVLIEHSHRLLASAVGLLSMGLVFLSRSNSYLFRRSLVALGLVIFQGVLGGLTVILQISPVMSTLHLATSQVFAAWLLWLCFLSRPQSQKLSNLPQAPQIQQKLKWALGLLFFQMLLGAIIRHGGAGPACGVGLEASLLCLDLLSGEATLVPTGLAAKFHMLHRVLGVSLVFVVVAVTLPLLKHAKATGLKALKFASLSPHLLVTLQVTLGVWSVASGIAVAPVTLHLLFACLLWLNLAGLYFSTRELFKESHSRATMTFKDKVYST